MTWATVIFGIRPEDLFDPQLESGRRHATIPAMVKSIEELGSELIVHLNPDAVRIDPGDPDAVEDSERGGKCRRQVRGDQRRRGGAEDRHGYRRDQVAFL